MRSPILKIAIVGTVAALALAACSSDDDSGSTAATTPSTAATTTTTAQSASTTIAAGAAIVKVGETSSGDAAVTADGMTLYLFENDTPTKSACGDGCDTLWPPVTVTGTPTANPAVTGKLGTITRDDGTKQLTIAGHPVYTYSADTAAGQANGQGLGGVWYVIAPNGNAIEGAS